MRDPRTSFEPTAASYLTSQVHSNPDALSHMIDVVQPHGGVVMDVATGAGHTAYTFAPHVDRVIASDITDSMLKLTRKTSRERGIENVDVIFAKAESLPIKTEALTGITCRMGAHHFDDVPRFVHETFRSIKPGGWFLLVDTVGADDDAADEEVDHLERVRDPSHRRNYRPSEWKRLVQDAGFSVRYADERWKPIDTEDWLERMQVPEPDRSRLRDVIKAAKGKLAEYLKPTEIEGRQHFHLREMLLLAAK